MNKGDDDRRSKNDLGDNHCRWREQQPQGAERSRSGEEQVHDQPHHHRRKAKQRVNNNDHAMLAGKAGHREHRSNRCSHEERNNGSGKTYTQRNRNDAD